MHFWYFTKDCCKNAEYLQKGKVMNENLVRCMLSRSEVTQLFPESGEKEGRAWWWSSMILINDWDANTEQGGFDQKCELLELHFFWGISWILLKAFSLSIIKTSLQKQIKKSPQEICLMLSKVFELPKPSPEVMTWTWVAFCAFLLFRLDWSIKGEYFPVATSLQINFVSNSSFLIRLYSFDLSGLRLGMAYVKQMILIPVGKL